MRLHRAGLWIALLAAIAAGCTPFARFRNGKVQMSAVAPEAVRPLAEEEATPAATPALVTFEATAVASGLVCTGGYNPLERSPTFTAAVVCEDGGAGKVTGPRSRHPGGTGTLTLADGGGGAVTLRRVTTAADDAPPAAANQLPAPDPSAYIR